jgi:uncharacterized membrane protein
LIQETEMTETLGHSDIGARFQAALLKLGGFLGKAGFGIFLIAAAVAALVATTFIGLMLAIAAVFLTVAHGFGRSRRRREDNGTLEARRTADGWVIEG